MSKTVAEINREMADLINLFQQDSSNMKRALTQELKDTISRNSATLNDLLQKNDRAYQKVILEKRQQSQKVNDLLTEHRNMLQLAGKDVAGQVGSFVRKNDSEIRQLQQDNQHKIVELTGECKALYRQAQETYGQAREMLVSFHKLVKEEIVG